MKNNDLSNCKAGDIVWTIREGWTILIDVFSHNGAVVKVITDITSSDVNGLENETDKYPMIYLEPPEGIDAEPKPLFKKEKWMTEKIDMNPPKECLDYADRIKDFLKEEISILADELAALKEEMTDPEWVLKSPEQYPDRTQAIVTEILHKAIPPEIRDKIVARQRIEEAATRH